MEIDRDLPTPSPEELEVPNPITVAADSPEFIAVYDPDCDICWLGTPSNGRMRPVIEKAAEDGAVFTRSEEEPYVFIYGPWILAFAQEPARSQFAAAIGLFRKTAQDYLE